MALKGFKEVSKGVGDFERSFEGFKGVSHDNYPPFKVAATRRDGDTRRKNDLRARSEFGQRGDGL